MRTLEIMYFRSWCEKGNNEAIPEKYKNRTEIGAWPAPRVGEYKGEGWSELAPVLQFE